MKLNLDQQEINELKAEFGKHGQLSQMVSNTEDNAEFVIGVVNRFRILDGARPGEDFEIEPLAFSTWKNFLNTAQRCVAVEKILDLDA